MKHAAVQERDDTAFGDKMSTVDSASRRWSGSVFDPGRFYKSAFLGTDPACRARMRDERAGICVVQDRQPGFHSTRRVTMQEEQIREALNKHWQASAAGDANAEHDIYDDDAICDYPQSGERILGRSNLQALRSHHPGKPSGFNVKRILGKGDLWITEYTITYQGRPSYTVSIMEFRNGKVVHETQYFADPFEAPAWRSQWVQQIA
jgi:hypothetical protein